VVNDIVVQKYGFQERNAGDALKEGAILGVIWRTWGGQHMGGKRGTTEYSSLVSEGG